jgi:hypothetical protein
MTEYPFIYICSHAGKIGNIRWVNSDTRWPDEYKPVPHAAGSSSAIGAAWVTSIHAQTRTT